MLPQILFNHRMPYLRWREVCLANRLLHAVNIDGGVIFVLPHRDLHNVAGQRFGVERHLETNIRNDCDAMPLSKESRSLGPDVFRDPRHWQPRIALQTVEVGLPPLIQSGTRFTSVSSLR